MVSFIYLVSKRYYWRKKLDVSRVLGCLGVWEDK